VSTSQRCAICVARKQGRCGTEFAISKCLYAPAERPPRPPKRSDSSLPTSSGEDPASGTCTSTSSAGRRCDICTARKKGRCGTDQAINQCLWHPRLSPQSGRIQKKLPAAPRTIYIPTPVASSGNTSDGPRNRKLVRAAAHPHLTHPCTRMYIATKPT
jgi:hypothetical protein